ncbi:uncharacterized protein E0L32_008678 [Thyridium curvatum]|uniref:Uncharacterized protein n=1 Tax=Thyridium curvatum TaxID=1093900 RepID=A0A507AR43_9PEZI|nr:uncharacterized protein E0L32_008678 [Thyridium curvatum]TPX10273.1 hypothetical protein E0L32_008678 [Thyridium curvatum]
MRGPTPKRSQLFVSTEQGSRPRKRVPTWQLNPLHGRSAGLGVRDFLVSNPACDSCSFSAGGNQPNRTGSCEEPHRPNCAGFRPANPAEKEVKNWGRGLLSRAPCPNLAWVVVHLLPVQGGKGGGRVEEKRAPPVEAPSCQGAEVSRVCLRTPVRPKERCFSAGVPSHCFTPAHARAPQIWRQMTQSSAEQCIRKGNHHGLVGRFEFAEPKGFEYMEVYDKFEEELAYKTDNMQLLRPILLSWLTIASVVRGEELEGPTVPAACRTICEPIVLLSNACDVELDEDKKKKSKRGDGPLDELEDRLEAGCLCQNKSFDVAKISALCADCIMQNPTDKEAVKDVSKIMSECAFSSTKYAPSATSLVAGITIVAIVPTVQGVASPPKQTGGLGDSNSVNAGAQPQRSLASRRSLATSADGAISAALGAVVLGFLFCTIAL